MRALRSRTASATSSSESILPEDSSTQEHGINERKPKKIRSKKLKKRRSQDNLPDDNVLTHLKNANKHKPNDCPTSSDDTFIKPISKKKRRPRLTEIEPAILFENAITSTQIKPKKHRKLKNEAIEVEVAQVEEAMITPPLKKKKKIRKTPGTSSSICSSENTTIIEKTNDESTFDVNHPNDHKSKSIVTVDDTHISPNEILKDGTSQKKKNRKKSSIQKSDLENSNQNSNLIYIINETTKFGSQTLECSPNTTLTKSETKVSIFEEPNDPNDYLKLDDISDGVINDIINISDDSIVKTNSRRGTFNISRSEPNSTFVKDMSPDLDHDKERDSFDVPVYNQSGEWQVQNGTITLDNSDTNNKTPENNWSTSDKTPRNKVTIKTPNKSIKTPEQSKTIPRNELELNTSIRKKWTKFAVDTPEAKAVLGKIYSPKPNKFLSARKSTNVSILKKSMLDLLNSPKPNISSRKSTFKSDDTLKSRKSEHKSQVKAMPNFALIHKKAFDKMESIQDYSNRKQERAKYLMSTDKSSSTSKKTINKENQSVKSARQLFSNSLKHKDCNRFGFKVKPQVLKQTSPKENKIDRKKSGVSENRNVIAKPIRRIKPPEVIKPITIKNPIFERKDLVAMGNKTKAEDPLKNRNKRRDDVRGFRTNRRFELLMKMRNNE